MQVSISCRSSLTFKPRHPQWLLVTEPASHHNIPIFRFIALNVGKVFSDIVPGKREIFKRFVRRKMKGSCLHLSINTSCKPGLFELRECSLEILGKETDKTLQIYWQTK